MSRFNRFIVCLLALNFLSLFMSVFLIKPQFNHLHIYIINCKLLKFTFRNKCNYFVVKLGRQCLSLSAFTVQKKSLREKIESKIIGTVQRSPY